MKKNILFITLVSILYVLTNGQDVFSWDNIYTHRDITEIATEHSVLSKSKGDYLKQQVGFEEGTMRVLRWRSNSIPVRKWLSEGAYREDEGSKREMLFIRPG